MNGNLFWGLFTLLFSSACWICAYVFGFGKFKKEERCSMRTVGKVIRYSAINYSGIHIPLVEYIVNGKKYKVADPKFLSGSVTTVSTPFENINAQFETNLSTRDNLPKKLKVRIHTNSSISLYTSPLNEFYPVDSSVDVYYNPKKPKEAFVQRFEGVSMWLMVMLVCFAVLLTAVGMVIMFGPKIVMK